MHECVICKQMVSYSLIHSVCFVCARIIRAALNRDEDQRERLRYQSARKGDDYDILRLIELEKMHNPWTINACCKAELEKRRALAEQANAQEEQDQKDQVRDLREEDVDSTS